MTGADAIKLAVVGCGAVADRYHLPAVAASELAVLTALVDPDLDRARALAERHGNPRVYASSSHLPGDVDAAIIAAPNHLHASIASDLLRAGVHCLIEKPLASTVDECDEIAAAADEGSAVVSVGHDFRRFPVATFAKALFDDGLLGAVTSVDLEQTAGAGWPYASTYAFSRSRSGGGVLLDFGVHMLDLLTWWLGEAHVVGYRDDTAGGVETECELELELANGAAVSFVLTRLRSLRDTVVVRCELGTAEIAIFEPAFLTLTLRDGSRVEGDVADDDFARAPLRTVFVRQLEDFVSAIRLGTTPLVSLADGRRAVALVQQCYAKREPLRRPWDWPDAEERGTR